jgi:hypothetical protein
MARLGRVPVWFRRRRMGLGPSSIAKEVNTYMEIGFSLVFNFDPGSAMCVDHSPLNTFVHCLLPFGVTVHGGQHILGLHLALLRTTKTTSDRDLAICPCATRCQVAVGDDLSGRALPHTAVVAIG